jgi:GTP-binding protein
VPELPDHPRIAIIGRPNVGKSTLINTLLGENRVIAFDQPGTTRDSIDVPFERNGRSYTLVDTAGLRRRGQVFESVEKFSVIKTLQSVDQSNVVVLVLDAQADISDQDSHIAGYVVEKGRAVVVAVNKWDGLDDYRRECVKRDISRKLAFLGFARFHFISALEGTGLAGLLPSIDEAYRAAMMKLPTPRLTRILIDAVERQQPPRKGLTRPKLRYAHQGGMNPPLIIIHGNALDAVPEGYRRYLEGRFRDEFALQGTPLKVQFKTSTNPYLKKT